MSSIFKKNLKKYINKKKIYLIAEAGVNHNGKLSIAKKLIFEAKKSGANAIKFQSFSAENVVTKNAKKAEYQIKNTKNSGTQFDMIKNLELKNKDFYALKKIAKFNNIDFISSVFDNESLRFVMKDLNLSIIKIPSGEITNYLLLKQINLNKNYVFLSTGMSNVKEIINAINCMSNKEVFSIKKNFVKIKNKILFNKIRKKIFIFHCVTDYPVKDENANLNCIETLSKNLKLNIGYSDHTTGTIAPLIAISKGATIIEKHFTLNKKMKGPDHKASLNPDEFKKLSNNIRKYEKMIGDGIKKIQKCELKNSKLVRKSIVAKKNINKNTNFNLENLTCKRPANGLSPFLIKKLLNKKSKKNYIKDQLIKIE